MKFHIAHVIPDPKMHGLHGYNEVIETLRWGLMQLGHSVDVMLNQFSPSATNILFGGHVLDLDNLRRLPAATINYNFEQIANKTGDHLRESVHYIAQHFQLWDYCQANRDTWIGLNPAARPKIVPVGYAPLLRRIAKRAVEDIDVLFYGLPSPWRTGVFTDLCRASLKCVFATGLYDASRDDLIARSKVVLNLNHHPLSRVFEIVRVSYLLANEKAVVSDIYPDSSIEADMRDAVAFAPAGELVARCVELVTDDARRAALAARGRAIMEARDIRPILAGALA